jgi:hypothetical protein
MRYNWAELWTYQQQIVSVLVQCLMRPFRRDERGSQECGESERREAVASGGKDSDLRAEVDRTETAGASLGLHSSRSVIEWIPLRAAASSRGDSATSKTEAPSRS